MSKKITTFEFEGTLIPVEYVKNKPHLQIKSIKAAIDVAITPEIRENIGRFAYGHWQSVVDTLRKVTKKDCQQLAYHLADKLEARFGERETSQLVAATNINSISVNTNHLATYDARQEQRRELVRLKAGINKVLDVIDALDDLEAGNYE